MFFNSNWLLIQLLIALFCYVKKGSRLSLSLSRYLSHLLQSVVLDVCLFIIIRDGRDVFGRLSLFCRSLRSTLAFPLPLFLPQCTANALKKDLNFKEKMIVQYELLIYESWIRMWHFIYLR